MFLRMNNMYLILSTALAFEMVFQSVVVAAIFKGAGNFARYNLSFDRWKVSIDRTTKITQKLDSLGRVPELR
jgi:hypothetical protein